jgi:hypothetical protein
MDTLKTAIGVVEIMVGIAAALLIGDYLGYKIGRTKLAKITVLTALGIIILFAIYAAIRLNQS